MNKFGNKCKYCNIILNENNCVKCGDGKRYIRPYCRECNKYNKSEYYRKVAENPDIILSYTLKQQHGMTILEYKQRLELQLQGCAICKKPCRTGRRLQVDHNHKTKEIRNLLCRKCNLIVGFCENDEDLVIEAIEYLKRHEKKLA